MSRAARRSAPRLPALLLSIAALFTACNRSPETEQTVADADSPATVTVLDPFYEDIFNPSWSMWARFLVYSPLVTLGEEGEFEPRLARSWEHSDDYRDWTFHLRTDVRWHDGEPFTARDVAFTLGMVSHPEVALRPKPEAVIVRDDSTVTVRRDRPWDGRERWWVYYPEHLLGDVDPAEFYESEFWTRPVGTGPFRYARHVPRTVFVLEANPDYFLGRPRVDRVRIKFGGGSLVAELESGNVDAATWVGRADFPRLEEDPRFRVYHLGLEGGSLEALYWNHDHPFLGDVAVRRALTMAIDRRELRRFLHLPEDLPISDVLFSLRHVREGALPPPLPHDPERARALLDSAGWRDADGDGVREREGAPARFTVLLRSGGNTGSAGGEPTAVYLQAAFRRVGVEMEIERVDAAVSLMIRSGEFEAALYPFDRDPGPAREWGPDAPYGYHDPALYRAFTALDTTVAEAARDSLYRESWPILRRDLPITFLGPRVAHFVAHRRIRGFEGLFQAHPYLAMEHLWVEEEP